MACLQSLHQNLLYVSMKETEPGSLCWSEWSSLKAIVNRKGLCDYVNILTHPADKKSAPTSVMSACGSMGDCVELAVEQILMSQFFNRVLHNIERIFCQTPLWELQEETGPNQRRLTACLLGNLRVYAWICVLTCWKSRKGLPYRLILLESELWFSLFSRDGELQVPMI